MRERSENRVIVIHGGAGGIPRTEAEKRNTAYQMRSLRGIIQRSWTLLNEHNHSAVDVAAETTAMLEAARPFNAGYGASLNELGGIELDASIMDGSTDQFAAVIGVTATPFPSLIARDLLTKGRHKVYAGQGADKKAREYNLPLVESTDELRTEYRTQRWQQWLKDQGRPEMGDTVGVVVFDGRSTAACSSTGGTTGKELGRVGDVPMPRAGIFATDDAAAAATGEGERIMEQLTAQTAVQDIDRFLGPDKAQFSAIDTMHKLESDFLGRGGVIMVTASGKFGVAHTSDTIMSHAIMRTGFAKPIVRRRQFRAPRPSMD